jgi:hypothetical protein
LASFLGDLRVLAVQSFFRLLNFKLPWRFKPFSPHQLITRAVRRIRYNDGNLKSMKDLRDEPV